jgi:hypothetical protein
MSISRYSEQTLMLVLQQVEASACKEREHEICMPRVSFLAFRAARDIRDCEDAARIEKLPRATIAVATDRPINFATERPIERGVFN